MEIGYGTRTREKPELTQKGEAGIHKLVMESRRNVKLTGISKVISFETDLILLVTDTGKLKITGKDMHILNLDIEKGLLDLNGKIDCLCYTSDKDARVLSLKRLLE